jgi:ABC-type uncharacterized transport system permease subunit
MYEIISYKICAVKVRNAKLRNYLKLDSTNFNAVEFCECLIAYFYSKIPLKILYLLHNIVSTVSLKISYLLYR